MASDAAARDAETPLVAVDELVRELSPEYVDAFLELERVARSGPLSRREQALVCLAVDAATTLLHEPATRRDVTTALAAGARLEEIMEVYALISVIGVHTVSMGVPILVEELEAAGLGEGLRDRPLNPQEVELQEEFERVRGYWDPFWDVMLRLDPAYFAAYLDFSGQPWRNGVLEPKLRELIYVAMDAATTHLYGVGTRVHIRNALGYGATADEIMQVFQLSSLIGVYAPNLGAPILADELGDRAAPSGAGASHS